ncbi:MAG TPA: hypothetical protein VHY22_11790, partial [Chthoniobacteraceae bacterium]|nr:hypothetical protein [Chthoniobacteraceae bacterium]
STSILWASLVHDKRFEQVPMSEAAPGDVIIGSGWRQGADGYAGIVVDHERIVSNSSQGVQNNSSLAEIQRNHPAMIAFRYVGFWNFYRSKSLANAGFNPAEARISAGQPGGGQWTSGGVMAAMPQIAFGGTPKSRNCASCHAESSVPRMRGKLAPDGSITVEPLPDKNGDGNTEPKTPGQALEETGDSIMSTLTGLARSIFHPDRESSKPKSFLQVQEEIDEALRGMDITTPKGLGRAVALAIVIVASEALSDAGAGAGDVSLPKVIERGPQGVIDQMSSNLEPKSLSNVQARDWYNATKVIRADIIDKMRAAGYSEEEIAHEAFELRNAARTKARELMKNGDEAADFQKKKPNLTWDEMVKKYNGDYNLITKKSLESNKEIDRLVEQLRQKH